MEIDAQVYIIADQKDLLPKAGKNLSEWIHNSSFRLVEEMEPSAALPLSRVWYGIVERAEPTYGPYEWKSSLQQCADLLGKHGAVIVEYRSPDYPDNYLEYAITTSGGNVSISSRLTLALANWKKSLGNDDLSLVLNELMKGSTSYDRWAAAKRTEKKAAERRFKLGISETKQF